MKTILTTLVSAVLTAVLTIGVTRREPGAPAPGPRALPEPAARVGDGGAPDQAGPDVPAASPARNASFRWAMLESPDYEVYIANLRAVGCPEVTLRDIIQADLRSLYEQRRAKAAPRLAKPFWQADSITTPAAAVALEKLVTEEEAILHQLLGTAPPSTSEDEASENEQGMPRYDGLPQEKQTLLAEGWRQFADRRRALLSASGGREFTPEEEGQMAVIEQEHREWLWRVLSPSELEEFDLRNSPSAERLRESLLGVEVSEAEFRALFQERRRFDEEVSRVVADGGGAVGEVADAFEHSAMSILGPDRYVQFARASDPDYREFAIQTLGQGWSSEEISRAWSTAEGETEARP